MSHAYSEIHLHITWHTKDDVAFLDEDAEPVAHEAIRLKALSFKGVIVRALDGVEDHVHVVVSIPPTLLISDLIGQMKGVSAREVNKRFPQRQHFAWQEGYGVVTFGTKDMPWVVGYVERQKEHHAAGTTHERLERVETPTPEGVGYKAEAP